MIAPELVRLIESDPVPTFLVTSAGDIAVANTLAHRAFRELQTRRLTSAAATPPERVLAYLRECAATTVAVPGVLEMNAADGRRRFRCEGAVVRPTTADEPALLVLRFKTHEEVDAALAEGEAVDQLSAEIRLRTETQRRLTDALAELEAVYATAPVGLAVVDTELRYMRVNARFAEMYGASVDAHIGRHVREIVPDLADQTEALLRRIKETGEPVLKVDIVGETPAQPGVKRVWNASLFPLRDPDGRIVGINVVAEDVTDRRQAEQAVQRLAAIVGFSDDAILSKDLDGIIVTWNRGAERLFGYTAEEAIGQSIMILIPPDRHDEEIEILERIRRGEHTDHYETVRQRKDGSAVEVSLTVSPVKNTEGGIIGASTIARDITERKQDEERLKLLAREVDHRAKNLLAVVQAMVRMTRADTVADFVDAVEGRIAALARAHMLLAGSRWTGADLRRLIEDEIAPYSSGSGRAQACGPTVTLSPESAQALAMALHELATNAAKYGALSAPEGRVSIEWSWTPEQQLVLRWAETGGPPVRPPSRYGFGSRLVERAIRDQLGGGVRIDWKVDGIVCELIVPVRNLARQSPAM